MSSWMLSPAADILGFVVPVLLAVLIYPFTLSLKEGEKVPLVAHLVLVVSIDVAHVYGTLYRTVLDSEATARNWLLYLIAGPGLLCLTLFVNLAFGTWFGWSLLAYYAMYHFAKQPFGLLCLYKARNGERGDPEHRWDYWTCMAGAGVPILLWHAGCFGDFRWFNAEDEKLIELPGMLQGPLWLIYVLVPLLWLRRVVCQWADGASLNVGKVWIMIAHYFTWFMGFTNNEVQALSFINLFHGFSSMALVYHVVQRRYAHWRHQCSDALKMQDRFNEAAVNSIWKYVGFVVLLAVLEEFAWEACVHKQYLPEWGVQLPELSTKKHAVVTSVLMLPQLSHYFLDGFIWRMSSKNPGLKEALLWTGHTTGKSRTY